MDRKIIRVDATSISVKAHYFLLGPSESECTDGVVRSAIGNYHMHTSVQSVSVPTVAQAMGGIVDLIRL